MKWGTVDLGDFTSIRTGKLDANASSEEGEYPFFTCAREPLRISSYSYDCECVLVAGNGDLNTKYYHGKFDAYQRTYIIEARPESQGQLYLRYIYHFLENYLVTLRKQSIGGIIKYIKLGNLTGARIPLPPLDEQKRIAKILDAADALRAKRRESLAQLDTLLQSTFLDMFGDPVTNPMGWETPTLGELVKVSSGNGLVAKDMAPDGDFPVYGGNGINGYHDAYMFEEPKIILGRVGVYCGVVHLTKPKAWVTDNALYIREFLHPIAPTYLIESLKIANLNQYASQAAQPLISGSRIYPVTILLPPPDVQRHFATIVESVEKQKATQRAHLAELDTLFASLQSRAFRGDL